MFGYVCASEGELSKAQKQRYGAVYCGICREIRLRAGSLCRLSLQYDMAFLALLLMSLYEPQEHAGSRACWLHPCRKRGYVESPFIQYAADMNVMLAYYKTQDDALDEGKLSAKALGKLLERPAETLRETYPRQWAAAEDCLTRLHKLEEENCPSIDEPASCFGGLMAELMVVQEDLWAPILRNLGMALGRYIYLVDAMEDYETDRKRGTYNPFLAAGETPDWQRWDRYLVLTMGTCCREFEKLPLVQDKEILNNILYSGVWCRPRKKGDKP